MKIKKIYHYTCKRKECRGSFTTHLSFKKYCSPNCYAAENRKYSNVGRTNIKKTSNTVCPKCGKEFYRKDADERVRRNFCSKCKDTMIRIGLLNRAGSEYTW